MGRSVNYLNRAEFKTFFDVSLDTDSEGKITTFDDNGDEVQTEPTDWDYQLNWDDFFGAISFMFVKKLGLNYSKKWEGDDVKIFAENRFCEVGISEYCGLASVSIRINDAESYSEHSERVAKAYIEYLWGKALKLFDSEVRHTRLNKIGSFSNGEGVYIKS